MKTLFTLVSIIYILSTSLDHSICQSIQFEELTPIPHTEVRFTFISPNEDLYVITLNNDLIRSTDGGDTWNQIIDPEIPNASFIRVYFLDSGTPIFLYDDPSQSGRFYKMSILHEGQYKNILPNGFEDYDYWRDIAVFEETIFIYHEGYLYSSKDYGASFQRTQDPRFYSDNRNIEVTANNIYIQKVITLQNQTEESEILDVYDSQFNFLYEVDLEFGNPPNGVTVEMYVDSNNLVFYDDRHDALYYSNNRAQSFSSINEIKGQIFGTFGGSFFYFRHGSNSDMHRIKLDNTFSTNTLELVITKGTDMTLNNHSHYGIICHNFSEFSLYNYLTDELKRIDRIEFPSSLVTDFHVQTNGDILASVRNEYLFESKDDGVSWDYLGSFLDSKRPIYFTENGYVISYDDKVVEWDENGKQNTWNIDAAIFDQIDDFYSVSNINNDEIRLLIPMCDDKIFISENLAPFELIEADNLFCFEIFSNFIFDMNIGTKLVDDHIFIYSLTGGANTTLLALDRTNNYAIEDQNTLNTLAENSSIQLRTIVSDNGQIFSHPIFNNNANEVFTSSFYAPNYQTEIQTSGGGPVGKISYNELFDYSMIISRSEYNIFIRNNPSDNFRKFESNLEDYGIMRAATFDNQGRLLVQTDHKPIYRADMSQVQTSTVELSELNVDLFPNPVSQFLNIETNENVNGSIKILDFSSRVIKQFKVNSNHMKIDLSDLNSGVYFVDLSIIEEYHKVFKVIKL